MGAVGTRRERGSSMPRNGQPGGPRSFRSCRRRQDTTPGRWRKSRFGVGSRSSLPRARKYRIRRLSATDGSEKCEVPCCVCRASQLTVRSGMLCSTRLILHSRRLNSSTQRNLSLLRVFLMPGRRQSSQHRTAQLRRASSAPVIQLSFVVHVHNLTTRALHRDRWHRHERHCRDSAPPGHEGLWV